MNSRKESQKGKEGGPRAKLWSACGNEPVPMRHRDQRGDAAVMCGDKDAAERRPGVRGTARDCATGHSLPLQRFE